MVRYNIIPYTTKTGARGYMRQSPGNRPERISKKLGEEMLKAAKLIEKYNKHLNKAVTAINQRITGFGTATGIGGSIMGQSITQMRNQFPSSSLFTHALTHPESRSPDATRLPSLASTWVKRLGKIPKIMKKTTKMITGLMGSMFVGFSMIGDPVMRLLDSMGVLQPIMDILSSILQVIGGSILQSLMPALQQLIAAITTPEFIAMLTNIGMTIGTILSPILQIFSRILIAIMPLIQMICNLLAAILIPILKAFEPVINSLTPVFESLFKALEPLIPVISLVAEIIGKVLAYAFVVIGNVIIGVVNAVITIINLFAWLIGVHMDYVSYLPLPSYERGGIALSDQIALVDKGEKMIPLEAQKEESARTEKMMYLLQDIAYTNQQLINEKKKKKFK